MVAYISKHRDGDTHIYCEDWPTPVALDPDEWVCVKPTDDPCMCEWFSLYKIRWEWARATNTYVGEKKAEENRDMKSVEM